MSVTQFSSVSFILFCTTFGVSQMFCGRP